MAYVVLHASYPLPMRMSDSGLLQNITVNVGYADTPDADYPKEFAGIIACERFLGTQAMIAGIEPDKCVAKLWPDFYSVTQSIIREGVVPPIMFFDVLRITAVELPPELLRHVVPILGGVLSNLGQGTYFVRLSDVPVPREQLEQVIGWQFTADDAEDAAQSIMCGNLLGESDERRAHPRGRVLEIYNK